jgi:hypothetical protein
MARKSLIILIAVTAVLAVGVFTVMAQDGDDNSPPFGLMRGGHHGAMMGEGIRARIMLGEGQAMHVTIAEALGIDTDTLFAELRAGKTLAEIAEALNVELQTVYDAVLARTETHLSTLIEAGRITQEQADARLALMQAHIAEMPMLSGGGLGPCWENGGAAGMSRMQHGRGMMMGRGWNN